MKILVTGGSGLLGSNLAVEMFRRGHEVTALYWQHAMDIGGIRAVPCNLANGGTAPLLVDIKPAWIIHCAAATNVEWCEAHPEECMRINAEAAGQLAAAARSLGAGLAYVSTDSVFNGTAGGYRETDRVSPVNRYACSKVAGELAVIREMPEALIVRVNIYGWNLQAKNSLAEWGLALLRSGQPVPGFCDVTFSPVLVNDVAGWILELIENRCRGIYHTGSSDRASKYDFLRELAGVFGLQRSLVRASSLDDSPMTARRPRNTWLRTEKLAAVLGRSMPSIREGLERFRALNESGYVRWLKAGTTT